MYKTLERPSQYLCTPIPANVRGKSNHLRRNSPYRPLDELHHPFHHTLPRPLTTDILPRQIPQPHQPTDPLIPNLPQPHHLRPHPIPILHPRPQSPLRIPLQQKDPPLLHALPARPAKDPLKLPHRLPKPLILKLRPQLLTPRRNAPDPAIAEVGKIRIPRRHDAPRCPNPALPQHLLPHALAALRIQQQAPELVLLVRHQRRRRLRARDPLHQPLLQHRNVRGRDVEPHHVDLDAEERHGADAQAQQLVFRVGGQGARAGRERRRDGRLRRRRRRGELDGLREGRDRRGARRDLFDRFFFRPRFLRLRNSPR